MAVEPLDLISLFAQKRPSIFKIKPENTNIFLSLCFQRFLEMSAVFSNIFWSSWLLFTFCGLDVTLPGPRCVPWSCQYQSPSMPSVSMSQYQCQYQYTSSYYKSQKRNTISRENQQYLGPNISRQCDCMTQKWYPVNEFEPKSKIFDDLKALCPKQLWQRRRRWEGAIISWRVE